MAGKHSKRIHPFSEYDWDYNGDGRFPTQQIKGKDKKRLQRWTRLYEKREARRQINEEGNE